MEVLVVWRCVFFPTAMRGTDVRRDKSHAEHESESRRTHLEEKILVLGESPNQNERGDEGLGDKRQSDAALEG